MKQYFMETVGTGLFVLLILLISITDGSLAPLYIGLALAVLVYIGGSVSGAHYNPAITFSLWTQKKINNSQALKYIASQIVGALIAYVIFQFVLKNGTPSVPAVSVEFLPVFAAEILGTYILALAVYMTAVSAKTHGNQYFGIVIGLAVAVSAIAFGSISGGFFNPAVVLGVGVANISALEPMIWLAILGGQLVGAVLAGFTFRHILEK